MKKEDFIINKYYAYEPDSRQYIFIFNGFNSYGNIKTLRKYLCNDYLNSESSNFSSLNYGKYRTATQEEINWLDACTEADKFIPLNEIKPKTLNYECY